MIAARHTVLALLCLAAFALGACAELTPRPSPGAGASEGPTGERRWSDGRLPRYAGPPAQAGEQAPLKVGLLLPLSGPYAAYGENLKAAAEMAVDDASGRSLELIAGDTAGDGEGAVDAAQAALAVGAAALIGPVTPARSEAVAAAAAEAKAPAFFLHADRRAIGPGVYVMGFAPEAGATRIVDFARRKGVTDLAVLAPDDAFGRAALRGAEAAAAARRMRIVHAERLAADAAPADALARVIAAAGPDGAVFLPFPATRLAELGIDGGAPGPMLLGLEAGAGFNGGYFVGVDPAASAAFRRRYAARFGQPPARGAAIVYDVTALLAAAAEDVSGQAIGVGHVATPEGYRGAAGPFRLTVDGGVRRGLAVLRIGANGPKVIEPAAPLAR